MMSPVKRSGTMTVTFTIGSRITGDAFCTASRIAIAPAI